MSISNETKTEANLSTFHIHHSYLIENWKIDAHKSEWGDQKSDRIISRRVSRIDRKTNKWNIKNGTDQKIGQFKQINADNRTEKKKIESTKQNITAAEGKEEEKITSKKQTI